MQMSTCRGGCKRFWKQALHIHVYHFFTKIHLLHGRPFAGSYSLELTVK